MQSTQHAVVPKVSRETCPCQSMGLLPARRSCQHLASCSAEATIATEDLISTRAPLVHRGCMAQSYATQHAHH